MSNIVLIDFYNAFLRNYVVNSSLDKLGEAVGGIVGTLNTISQSVNMFVPSKVIICCDGRKGRDRRRRIYPDYKAGRKSPTRKVRQYEETDEQSEKDNKYKQMEIIRLLFEYLPVNVVEVETCEADDLIAYICEQLYLPDNKFICSTDKDYLSLITNNVKVYSPVKKKLYDLDKFNDEYNIDIKNFGIFKSLIGDKGDNIHNIKGIGPKTIKKLLPILKEDKQYYLDDIFKYCQDVINEGDCSKNYKIIMDNREKISMNFDISQLKSTILNAVETDSINEQLKKKLTFNVLPLKMAIDNYRLISSFDQEKFFERMRFLEFTNRE